MIRRVQVLRWTRETSFQVECPRGYSWMNNSGNDDAYNTSRSNDKC